MWSTTSILVGACPDARSLANALLTYADVRARARKSGLPLFSARLSRSLNHQQAPGRNEHDAQHVESTGDVVRMISSHEACCHRCIAMQHMQCMYM